MRSISQALREHKQAVLNEGYAEDQILGIFLYGSQNYNTDTEDSDVDTKAIIVPSLEDLCLRSAVSREIHLENGEHCEIKDIREIVKNFRKQNINFIEILYTDYCWVNPKYKDIWNEQYIEIRDLISHYDPLKCIESITKQALHTISQGRTNGKKISNALRFIRFLMKYIKSDSYYSCLTVPTQYAEWHRNLKKIEVLSDTLLAYNAENILTEILENIEEYASQVRQSSQDVVDNTMNIGIIRLVKRLSFDF